MRLNKDCLRDILNYIEEHFDQNPKNLLLFIIEKYDTFFNKYSREEVCYHIQYCIDSGYIDGQKIHSGGIEYTIKEMRHDGHEFLDTLR